MKETASQPLRTVLLVDMFDRSRIAVKWFLGNLGYVVDSVRSAEEALAVFDPSLHDLVVTDNKLSGMSGTEMAHIVKMRSPKTPVVMYAGQMPEDSSCLDLVVPKPDHLLMEHHLLRMKVAMDDLLEGRATNSGRGKTLLLAE